KELAEKQHPKLVGIPLDKPFAEEEFARDLGQVKTRLGGDDYRADLARAVPGPFGQLINELSIPDWQFHTPPEDETAKSVSSFDGGFTFEFGGHTFKYNRLGLTKQP
ncbi:MAG: CRISPR-associated helicase/endonuclease Cas3, partial [Bacteroidetes bacterium]|nr:CRISPR-associated helicase/endonuclease Cas3 [Bacteroidota bacterium]